MVTTERRDGAFIVRMDAGDNSFTPPMLDALESALDEAQSAPEDITVLTGTGSRFSLGLDLGWMAQAAVPDQDRVIGRMQQLFARLLASPTVTVAAINGHAFGGGAMLALACERRVMRDDRGWLCLPEVDFRLPFTAGMTALITTRAGRRTAHEMMLTGRRYDGAAAKAAGIVHETAGADALIDAAIEAGRPGAGKDRAISAWMKRDLYAAEIEALATSALDRTPMQA